MNAAGQVVDSAKVEAGRGVKTVGLEGRMGEVTGQPVPGGQLTKLQIGMTVKQVIEAIGAPSDQGPSATYKAWLPWVAGRDQYRYEMVYKAQGRLIFEGGDSRDGAGSRLVWVIHCAGERGYR